jgi:hypothetical protein
MLQAAERPRAVASRIQGQTAIRKSLQLLLVRTHRYAKHRATTPEQRIWAAAILAAVQQALDVPTTGEVNYPRNPVRKSDRMLKMALELDALSK